MIDFLRMDSITLLEILVVAQLCTRIFIVTTSLLRQFVLKDKKSSVQILVLKFLKVKIKILIVISLYWNTKACTICGFTIIGIAVFNILVTIGQLIGTIILNSSFRFEEENLICQKNQSLLQSMLIFPIMYFLNFHGLFYASCLISFRCFVQLYQNFNNIENRAIQYCDYFSPLMMLSFCVIEIISNFSGRQLLKNENPLFFFIIFFSIIYGANCLTQTLIVLVPKYHLRKCTYFTKFEDKPSLMETEGIMHVSESEEKQFIVALRVLAKVYITKQKMEGSFVIKENPYHGSEVRQDEFDLFWQEFNKIIINHRMYCSNVTCPCLRKVQNDRENSQIAASLFLDIMFTSLQKILNSTNSTILSIIEKYFYIELLQKPIKNYFLLVKLKSIVKKSEQILEVDLLMDETREMLGHLMTKGKAQNQQIEIDELLNFQSIMKNLKRQFIQISSEYKSFYDLFYTSFVDIVLLKQHTKNLIDLKKQFNVELDKQMAKYSRNIEFLSYAFIYYTYFEEYTENSQQFKSKISNFQELNLLNNENAGNNKNNLSKNIDVLDPIYGAIKVDLVWRPGEVVSVTKNVCELFGYKMDEIQGQKVNKLMPGIFARFHDRFIQRFVQNGTLSMLKNKEKIIFGKNSKNFIFPVVSRLKLEYKCGESFSSSTLIKKTAKKSEFIMLNNFGKIEEISQNLYRLLFKKSLKDDVLKIKRLNAYKMLLSLNHFVKNPNEMDDKIYEGMITTVQKQELLMSFYKNIDLSNTRNGQQFQNGHDTYFSENQQSGQNLRSTISQKNISNVGSIAQNIPFQANQTQKFWTNMKQMLKDFYMRFDIDKIKAYRVMYRFSNEVTSQFTCKIIQIVSIKEEIPENTLKSELPKEMVEIGELYGLPDDVINRMKEIHLNYDAYCQINNLMGALIKTDGEDYKFRYGQPDQQQKNKSMFEGIGQNQTENRNIDNLGSFEGSNAENAQKSIKKSTIITSFSLKTFVNSTLESTLTVSILLAFLFLVIICIFSTTMKPNYEKLQKDNSIINNFMINFESHLAIEELNHFYDTLNLEKLTSLNRQKSILTDSMKRHLINSIEYTDSEISSDFFQSPIQLNNIKQNFQEIEPTITTLQKIYNIFLMNPDKVEFLSENYHVIVSHLQSITVQEKERIFESSQSLRFKIGAIVSLYGLSLVVLIVLMISINFQSIKQEQKIIDFLPFINKTQLFRKIIFFQDIMDDMKENEDINLNRIEQIEALSMLNLEHEKLFNEQIFVQKESKKKMKKSLPKKKYLMKENQKANQQKTDDLRFIRILNRDQKILTVTKGIFLLFLAAVCLVVIVQTDQFFLQAHKKFVAYTNLKQSVLKLQNLVPRTLLTYLINIDKIINSESLVQLPANFYQTPTSQIFNLRLELAQADTNNTQMANHLNKNLNTQICILIDCDPNYKIINNTDVYFLIYRFINVLEFLRKSWSYLQISTTPKQDIQSWINEGRTEDLLKSLEQILELMKINEQQISELFTQQINSIGYQLLYFSLVLIPVLIISMCFLRQQFISFVYQRIESIENTYKQFSWSILSQNSYAINYFENKLRESKQY